MLSSKDISILITGGTGSFGKCFLEDLFKKMPDVNRVVIYSRDEMKQWELKKLYIPNQNILN